MDKKANIAIDGAGLIGRASAIVFATSGSVSRTASTCAQRRARVSNAQQIAEIRTISNELSLEVATADEARRMLALKGNDNVGFCGNEAVENVSVGQCNRFSGPTATGSS